MHLNINVFQRNERVVREIVKYLRRFWLASPTNERPVGNGIEMYKAQINYSEAARAKVLVCDEAFNQIERYLKLGVTV